MELVMLGCKKVGIARKKRKKQKEKKPIAAF